MCLAIWGPTCRSDTPIILPSTLLIPGAVAAEAHQVCQESSIRVSCPLEFEGTKNHHALWSLHSWRRTWSSMAGNTLLNLLTTYSSTSKGEENFRRRLSLRSNLLRPCGSHTVSSSCLSHGSNET